MKKNLLLTTLAFCLATGQVSAQEMSEAHRLWVANLSAADIDLETRQTAGGILGAGYAMNFATNPFYKRVEIIAEGFDEGLFQNTPIMTFFDAAYEKTLYDLADGKVLTLEEFEAMAQQFLRATHEKFPHIDLETCGKPAMLDELAYAPQKSFNFWRPSSTTVELAAAEMGGGLRRSDVSDADVEAMMKLLRWPDVEGLDGDPGPQVG